MKLKNDSKEIPRRNYIIYALLVVFTVILTLLLRNLYNISQDLKKKNTVMSEFLVSVNEEEFANYVVENNNVIIYLASSRDDTLENFENEFKELLIEYNISEQIIFIDLNEINDSFFKNLKNSYFIDSLSNVELEKFPNILIMENGKINAVLYHEKTDINIEDVTTFFYNRGVLAQA